MGGMIYLGGVRVNGCAKKKPSEFAAAEGFLNWRPAKAGLSSVTGLGRRG